MTGDERRSSGSWLIDLCTGAAEEQSHLVVFHLRGVCLALPVGSVEHADRLGPVTAVPGAAPFVRGVVITRGQVVPLVDLAARLGLPQKGGEPEAAVLVVRVGDGAVGVLADRGARVVSLPREAVEPPAPEGGYPLDEAYVAGVARVAGEEVLVLDVEQVLAPADAEAEERTEG